MGETKWDIQEIKYLKRKQLVQNNLVILLLFVLLGYFAENGKDILIFGVIFVTFWIIVAVTLYILITGRPIGTRTNKRVQIFDRHRLGEKRWKRKKVIETVGIGVIAVFVTVLMFDIDFNAISFDFPIDAFPLIGVWIGYNIGEIIRMQNL